MSFYLKLVCVVGVSVVLFLSSTKFLQQSFSPVPSKGDDRVPAACPRCLQGDPVPERTPVEARQECRRLRNSKSCLPYIHPDFIKGKALGPAELQCQNRTAFVKHAFTLVAEMLNSNKLEYWIAYGTLLGWWRHNESFIPWDLDADIMMMKSEYLKLYSLIVESVPPEQQEGLSRDFVSFYHPDTNKWSTDRLGGTLVAGFRWARPSRIQFPNGLPVVIGDTETGSYVDVFVLEFLDEHKQFLRDGGVHFTSECSLCHLTNPDHPKKRCIFPTWWVFPIRSEHMNGVPFPVMVPRAPLNILQMTYGMNLSPTHIWSEECYLVRRKR